MNQKTFFGVVSLCLCLLVGACSQRTDKTELATKGQSKTSATQEHQQKPIAEMTPDEIVASCLELKGQEALVYCKSALAADRNNAAANNAYINNMADLDRQNELIKEFTQDMDNAPTTELPYLNLCRLYIKIELPKDAIQYCQKAIEIAPDDTKAIGNIGIAYRNNGENEKSLEYLRKATKLDPQDADAFMRLAGTLAELNRADEALKTLEQSKAIKPPDEKWYLQQGTTLSILHRYEEALVAVGNSEKIKPDFPMALYFHAMLSGKLNKKEDSYAYIEKALKIEPNNKLFLSGHAFIQASFEDYEDAIKSYAKYLALYPEDVSARKLHELSKQGLAAQNKTTNIAGQSTNNSVPQQSFKIGVPIRLGDYIYAINKVQTMPKISGGYTNYTAQQGALLVLVEYSIENISQSTQTVMTDDFRLKDFKERLFSPSSGATTAYQIKTGKDMWLSQLQPNLKRTMASVFELPTESVNAGGLKLIIPEKGWGNSNSITIDLN